VHQINRIARINHDLLADGVLMARSGSTGHSGIRRTLNYETQRALGQPARCREAWDIHDTEKSFHSDLAI
jgi:hypothetical protein